MKTSVALCTYNGEKFLRRQIDSILNQTSPVDEIIICDDGSKDATLDILNGYQKKFTGVFKIYQNDTNLGSVKNFEKAISLCENEIIFLSDQDDLWIENKVEVILNYFALHPAIDVVATNGYGVDENNKELQVHSLWDIPRFFRERGIEVNYFHLIAFSGNIATGASMALRKEFVSSIIPFPVIDGFHHDEWIALIAASKNSFEMLNDKLFKYRVHANQQVGEVFFDATEQMKNVVIRHFDYHIHHKDFKSFKRILKRISNSYKKNRELSKEENYRKIGEEISVDLKKLYFKHKAEMLRLHPIKSALLYFSDSVLNKRKLK